MSARLVVEIEIPGFHVDDIVEFLAGPDAGATNEEEALDESMNADDQVVVVFLYQGDFGDPKKLMQPMEGRIVGRRIAK